MFPTLRQKIFFLLTSVIFKPVSLKSNPLDIKDGIFQGDSLSPLFVCLALNLLTTELNRTGYGYKISKKSISYLFYMDHLKLLAKNDHELEGMLQTVKKRSSSSGLD